MLRACRCRGAPSPPKTSSAASPTRRGSSRPPALGVDPADCIVVEDSANGIAAGLAAGMRVIGVGPHAAEGESTWLVTDASGIHVAPAADGRIAVTIG